MYFTSWTEFLAMGGHGLYVWLAYGMTLAVLLGSFIAVRRARRMLERELRWSGRADGAQRADEMHSASGTDAGRGD